MSLEDISTLSQIVAAVAVVVSLIYAGLQFGIYVDSAHEARIVAQSADMQQFRLALAADADFARIYRDGLVDMTKLEALDRWRFGAMMQIITQAYMLTRDFEDLSQGMIEGGWQYVANHPGYRQWWINSRVLYTGQIRAHIDDFLKYDPSTRE